MLMKAILMTSPGPPDVLRLAEVDRPEAASPHDLLVRVKAAGINPIDTKLRQRGTYYPDRMPAILGCDGAGVVEAVGNAVTRFRPGDPVYYCSGGIGGHPGNYAEYAVVDERFAAGKPERLDFGEAAGAPLVFIVAWESLHDRARIQPGQTVLIHAGAGGVGHVAIQMVKAAGCRVITTVRTTEQAELARELGADQTVFYEKVDFVDAVRETTPQGVDAAIDTVGGPSFQKTFDAVRPYGDVVTLLQPDASVDWKSARLRNLRISLELMLSPMYFGWTDARRHQAEILERCAAMVDRGELRIHVSHRLDLEQAAEGHRLIEQGGMMGKVVLMTD